MLTRRILAAGLALSFLPQGALAEQPAPALTLPPEPVLILDASLDLDDRLTVPVRVNGQGPFDFVVDSGADRSVLSAPLADRLGLAQGPNVLVHGVGGAQITHTAQVGELVVGDTRLSSVNLPILPLERVGADGLLGIDILEGRNVIMDFRKRKLEIRRSRSPFDLVRLPREVSVMADDRFGRLTVADCRVAGAKALAFIDSGGGVSIGNMALSRAIATRRRRQDDVRSARLLTASGEISVGEYRIAPSLTLGDLRMTNVPMAFADLHIFDVWRLNDRPALLLGVDILQLFSRVELDFGAGRVLFRIGGVTPPRILSA
ncbi:retroviral-like aspartic protease family protein [Caulobacter sp. ErkDOM-YI]|uniref:retroviral-like aspartic protease family protein n=1 Tax=unclassified Caulobacter TaxID=2648921 RepID=UPI003AF9805D